MAVLTLKSEEYKTFPPLLRDYATYLVAIKSNAEKTVCEYLLDLRTFFRFYKAKRDCLSTEREQIEEISISDITIEDAKSVTESMILEFIVFARVDMKNKSGTQMRKLSAVRSFFKYLYTKKHLIDENPASDIDGPKRNKALPKYLTVEEAVHLLEVVKEDKDSRTCVRDYSMIALFLNTGMRLSELVGLNLESFDSELNSVKVIGKGGKERIIYLNNAARSAVKSYLKFRLDPRFIRTDDRAFYLSARECRISNKTVQWVIYKYLEKAGYGYKGLSVHKLRHTAATLMYQSGRVDIRVLKDILGHEQLNTTQIYTHVVNKNLEDAMANNPLSDVVIKNNKNRG